MSEVKITHVGFADESNWNTGRFRSIGLVTLPLTNLLEMESRLREVFKESGISEFKWEKLRGARERFAAIKMCEFAVEMALEGKLRVDVLIWDIQDSRHNVKGRDDIANLHRMYYHLFKNVLRERWPDDSVWRLHPDEHTAMDWNSIKVFLDRVSSRLETYKLSAYTFGIKFREEFGIKDIVPLKSEYPLLQLADLFAGLAVFSWDNFDEYQRWLTIFSEEENSIRLSKKKRERFRVLKFFNETCKNYKLGVSLNSRKGLWTPKPNNPLNFWMYDPQHPLDKAPTK